MSKFYIPFLPAISVRSLLLILFIVCIAGSARAQQTTDSIDDQRLDELVVTGASARQRIGSPRLGTERLELAKLALTPSFGGENDIIRSIALLPGVRGEGDGGGGFEVRGGNASQNLVMLDGITLYNPAHVLGIFSTFNDNALGTATLHKGPIPAMYGGATSSVLETSLSPGDMADCHVSATVGILAAKVMAQGPIVKDKLSVAVAARRSYVDAFLKMVPQYRSTVMNFYDVSAKARFRPSAAHLVDGSFFVSRDNMAVDNVMGMYWGNLGASVNWTASAGGKCSFITTAALTHFNPKMVMGIMDVDQIMKTYIHNYSLNERVRFAFGGTHSFMLGLRTELLRVKSAEWTLNATVEREVRSLWENSVWAEYAGSFGEKIDITAGLRLDVASAMSGRRFHDYISSVGEPNQFDGKTYLEIGPRVGVKYCIAPFHNVKAGVGTATQNLQSIRSSSTSFPFDRYALASAKIKPERAVQYGAGYFGMTPDGAYDWSVEGYFKDLTNVYDYKDGRSSFSDIVLENIILGGKGRSYGAEFMFRKNTGALTGWVAYTLSRTQTRIPGINDGRWYNAANDRRHDLSIAAIWHLSDRWDFSGSWIFSSGQPLTAPDAKYEIAGETCYYYSQRNAYKTPPTHRLDLSATYTHKGDKVTYQWAFGIYNAYCRYNPYVVYFEDDPSKPSGTRAVQQSLYGLIPSVSYTLKF